MPTKFGILFAAGFAFAALAGCAHVAPHNNGESTKAFAPSDSLLHTRNLAESIAVLDESPNMKTLLVLDIDDTLLTSARFFGSDEWFGWQRKLADGDAHRVPCLFDFISMNTEIGMQKRTQPDGPAIVNGLMKRFDTLVLTSRNAGTRGATIRELIRAGYDLPAPLTPSDVGLSYRYTPPGGKTVTVAYDRGVFMTEGQDKGVILFDLLAKLGRQYERVVLIDDGANNHTNVGREVAARGLAYRGIQYEGVDKSSVDPAEIAAADRDWAAWMALLDAVAPERAAGLRVGTCAANLSSP